MSANALLDALRQVRRPTVFLPGHPSRDPEEFVSLPAALERLRQLADGQPLTFKPGTAFYPDFDAVPSIHVYAGGTWVASLGNRWDEPAQAAALATLRAAA